MNEKIYSRIKLIKLSVFVAHTHPVSLVSDCRSFLPL
jgi:hypothetical protein